MGGPSSLLLLLPDIETPEEAGKIQATEPCSFSWIQLLSHCSCLLGRSHHTGDTADLPVFLLPLMVTH